MQKGLLVTSATFRRGACATRPSLLLKRVDFATLAVQHLYIESRQMAMRSSFGLISSHYGPIPILFLGQHKSKSKGHSKRGTE